MELTTMGLEICDSCGRLHKSCETCCCGLTSRKRNHAAGEGMRAKRVLRDLAVLHLEFLELPQAA